MLLQCYDSLDVGQILVVAFDDQVLCEARPRTHTFECPPSMRESPRRSSAKMRRWGNVLLGILGMVIKTNQTCIACIYYIIFIVYPSKQFNLHSDLISYVTFLEQHWYLCTLSGLDFGQILPWKNWPVPKICPSGSASGSDPVVPRCIRLRLTQGSTKRIPRFCKSKLTATCLFPVPFWTVITILIYFVYICF